MLKKGGMGTILTTVMPFYRFDFDTHLSEADAIGRVQAMTRPPLGFLEAVKSAFSSHKPDSAPFIGKVEGRSFRLRRDIRYKNSFLPTIRGEISPGPGGSRVSITMRIHPLVAVFMAVFLSGAGYPLWHSFSSPVPPGAVRTSMIFLFIAVAITAGGFVPEALKAKKMLEESLERNPG